MVAPQSLLRKAESARGKPRWVEAHKARPRTVYDAATGVNVQTSGMTHGGALAGGSCIGYRGGAIGRRRRRRGETCPDRSCEPTPGALGRGRRPETPTRKGR